MQIIPVKTKVVNPPQEDIWPLLRALPPLQEGDVVAITSKIVAIHEGTTLPYNETQKLELIVREADLAIPRPYAKTPLTIKEHAFIGSSGIDESNADGHFILLPKNLFAFAKEAHTFLTDHFKLKHLGVIVTDSHSQALRYGATGIALAWFGIKPLRDHRGRADLFGRKIVFEKSNVVDGIAAASTLVAGEVDEGTPIVIARDVPGLEYTKENSPAELFIPYHEDMFRVLYERYLD